GVWTALMLGLIVTGCRKATSAKAGTYAVQETHLGTMDAEVLPPVFSTDGRHFAFVTRRDQKVCVVVDGQAGAEFDNIGEGTPLFSPDGKRVAYGALKGKKQLVVVDGQAGAECDGILEGTPIFSHDGRLMVYGAKTGEKWLLMVNGQ